MNPRVLFILHLPPPVHGAAMVGKCIHDSELVNRSFDCRYINLTTAASLEDIGKVGFKKLVLFWRLLKNVRHTVKEFKPDLVYVTPNAKGGAFYKDFLVVQMIKSMGCKVLAHYHNKGVKHFSKSKLNDWLYRMFYKNLNVLLLGEVLYEDVAKYVPLERACFCGNGLPELTEEENRKVLENHRRKKDDLKSRSLNILYLSNMMAEKGAWILVDACKVLKDKGIDFRCAFVGGWKDITEDAFHQKILQLDLEAEMNAVGPKYDAEKEPYWMDADIFVFPTYYHNECFPLVLLEAMQHALPCISTKEGAIPNIIDDGETGFIVNANSPVELASKIVALAVDKPRRLDMGMSGYRKFQNQYTLNVFEKRMCEVLDKFVKGNNGQLC